LISQDAKKGVLFLDFPPVLQLQLKRFEYDYMRDSMVKVCSDNLHFVQLVILFMYFRVHLICAVITINLNQIYFNTYSLL
jgi:hypothetical protein